MISVNSTTRCKKSLSDGTLSTAGSSDSLGSKPFKSLTTSDNAGRPIAVGSLAAVGPSHDWLRMVGTIPTVGDYGGSADGVTDGVLTGYFLNRRQWGRPRSPVRVPKTLLIVGYSPSSAFRSYLASLLGPLTAIGVDVIGASLASTNHSICPLIGAFPVADSVVEQIGSLLTGPGTQPVVAYRSVSCREPADFDGGQLLVFVVNRERMEFGQLSNYSVSPTGPASGVDADITSASLHFGYVFRTYTEWDVGDDPGDQSFSGCTEVGRTEVAIGAPGRDAGRIQMFLNDARAAEDRSAMTAYAARFERFHLTFVGNENSAVQGSGLGLTVEERLPGDPAAVAASIDGGSGLVSYFTATDDWVLGDDTAEDVADEIVSRAVDFFS